MLIVNERCSVTFKGQFYSDAEQTSDIKQKFVLVSAVKPISTLSPILIAVGVEMDHMFGSKWQLIEFS